MRHYEKTLTIVEYNAAKSFTDVSDQLTPYASTIRVKQYKKILFEWLNAVVNDMT